MIAAVIAEGEAARDMTADSVTSPLLSQALAYLQDGDPQSAELLVQTYLDRNPEDATAHHIAGLCRHGLNDLDGARTCLERAVALAPQDTGAGIQLAMVLADLEDPAAALSVLDHALMAEAGNIDLLLARSTLQRRFNDSDGASATAQMAVAFDPSNARAHYALGLALTQSRQMTEARQAFEAATTIEPDFADAWVNLGVVQKEEGDFESADDSYAQALAVKPNDPITHNNYGNLVLARGDLDKAAMAYSRAIELDPDYTDAKVNLALAYREQGDAEKSLRTLEKIVEDHPDHVSVLNSLGNALRHAERFEEARDVLEKAVALDPGHAEAHNNLGLALALLGRRDDAEAMFGRAAVLRPDMPVIANNYGTLLLKMFHLERAIEELERAVTLDPVYQDAWVNLGVAHFMLGHYDEAVSAYRQVIAQDPNNAFARYSLGVALLEQQDLPEAVKEIELALEANPENVMALNTLGVALLDQHRVEEARDAMARAAAADTMSAPVYASNFLFTSLYHQDIGNDEIFEIHKEFGSRFTSDEPNLSKPHAHVRDPDRKLRLAYMSPDFRGHSVSYFMEPLLEKHDRSAFEIILYSNTTRADVVTAAMEQAADEWVETAGLTDQALVERMRDDQIDILVNLGGHTSGNRLVVCGQKPAPVQIEYVGYPDTSGVTAMDYRLTDERADPSGEADARCVEALIRLPDCFHCYRPTAKAPPPAPAPHLDRGYVTFGSLNVLPKLNQGVVEAWAEILKHVPQSRLYLKCKQLKTELVRDRVLGYFEAAGIEPERISMEAFVPSVQDHLNRYAGIDLGLDTFPYNGTTTTCEALWMGVPVLSVTGNRHTGRVGLSLLHAVGLDQEFVAPDVETYIARAIAWGNEPSRLAEVRDTLRDRMMASPLRDEVGFTRGLEGVYRDVWRTWCAGPTTYERMSPEPLKSDDSVQSVLTKVV